MIGTSEGEQFTNSFEHTLATMPPGASREATGALFQEARYPGSPQPLGPPQFPPGMSDSEKDMRLQGERMFRQQDQGVTKSPLPDPSFINPFLAMREHLFGKKRLDESEARDPSKNPDDEKGLGGWIDPDSFLSKKGIDMPKSDMGMSSGDKQGDRMDRNPLSPFNFPEQQRQWAPESIRKNINLDPRVMQVLSHPDIANAIANPKIDRTHDVPYEAGASSKPNDFTTHIDKHIPSEVTISGQTFDPAIPANIHEQVEREVMNNLIKKGMSNEKAYEIAHHEFAEPAEDAWYQHHGIDIKEVNAWWAKQDKTTEAEGKPPKGDIPPDLYKKPYPHGEVEGVKHEPSGVAAEWPIRSS